MRSVSEDNSGRWALKNVERGYFLGSSSDKLTCTAKVPGDAELWHVHLAARPQVNWPLNMTLTDEEVCLD